MSWPIYTIRTHMRNFGRQRESNDGNSLRPGGLECWVLVPNVRLILTTLESVIQSEVSQKEKNKYSMLTHIYGI